MDPASREKKIMNALFVVCIAAGFACFALITLPDQLKKIASPGPAKKTAPENISSIVSLDAPEEKTPAVTGGDIARFKPEPLPARPGAPNETGGISEYDAGPAGGAGAAIDGASAEAALAYAGRPPEAEAPRQSQQYYDDARAASGSINRAEFRQFPISSITRGEPSALGNPKSLEKKSWLVTPLGLETDVAFWRDIYSKYDRNQSVLHHPRRLDIVYEVVDLSDIDRDPRLSEIEKRHLGEKRVEARRKAVTDILIKLSEGQKGTALTEEEWRIKKLFQGMDETDKFRRAAIEDGVRSQTGQRDKFIEGLKISGRYLGEVEAIFESYMLPRELTRLVFVESMFNPSAVSYVGASGIWQFMRETGKLYVQLNNLVDERNDPVAATHAAARLLRQNYEALGSWPLAINAYNTGRGRIKQAKDTLGTSDIGTIIKNFSHPAYGFASRNFFLEFLAALDVAERAEKYFGPIEFEKPLRYETVRADYNISLPEVARIAGISEDEVGLLNPAFTAGVRKGEKLLPAGQAIRVPEGKSALFLASAARAPKSKRGPLSHVVQNGETLTSISEMYRVAAQEIVKSNRLVSRMLKPGQIISVPVGSGR